jgi:hypothetical protein
MGMVKAGERAALWAGMGVEAEKDEYNLIHVDP